MGIIYKLKPEIKNFVIEEKKAHPKLSCRSMSMAVENKFQVKVSKSSINSIFKEAGLSLPMGGGEVKKKQKLDLSSVFKSQEETKFIKLPESVVLLPLKEPQAPQEAAQVKLPIEEPKLPQQEPEPILKPPPPQEVKIELPIEAVKVIATLEYDNPTEAETECTGAILLKAADYLTGGCNQFAKISNDYLNRQESEFFVKTEGLVYNSLFEIKQQIPPQDLPKLWFLVNKKIPPEDLLSYIDELQSVSAITADFSRVLEDLFQEVRCIKITLSNGCILYLDGQLHTIWSTPHIPYGFNTTLTNAKSYINKYFYKDEPLAFFMAPGYDTPINEFFNFIHGLDSREKGISSFTFYDNKFEEIESVFLDLWKKHYFVFSVWPWQFVEYRKVRKIGEFKPTNIDILKKSFFVADIELELTQHGAAQSITLKGYALKTSLAEKTRLIVLSNLAGEAARSENILNLYFGAWPNMEEAFQDYSRKIELFTYMGSSQLFFSTEVQSLLSKDTAIDIKTFFPKYLKTLDLYVRWHFFPSGYENKDLLLMKERFYNLKANVLKQDNRLSVTFQPAPGFAYLKDLEYASRRINEKGIILPDGKRLWIVI